MDLTAETIRQALGTRRFGRPLYYFDEIGSTMPEAARRAAAGEAEGTLVIADAQVAGRGRLGRTWLSAAGVNLTFSLILRPTPEQLRRLPIAVAVAGVRAVRALTGLPAQIKWPNDLVLHDRKFAGILIDTETIGDQMRWAILGIGLNVNLDVAAFPEIRDSATSLATAAGRSWNRTELLARLLTDLEDCYDRSAAEGALLAEWRDYSATLGRRVEARSAAGVEIGLAEAADDDGALLLRRDDGSLRRLLSGEISLRPAD